MNKEEIIDLDQGNIVSMSSQVAETIRSGLPLESGLRALAEQTRSRRTQVALITLSERLEQGMPLAAALEASRAHLPQSMGALVEAGLETGRLDGVMQYCVEQSQRAISLRQQIWLCLAYPLFLIWFGAVICGVILLGLTPQFRRIFDDFGTELPPITLAIVNVSAALGSFGWWPWVLLALICPIVVLNVTFFGVSSWGNKWSTSLPLIGRVFRFAALSELCRLLALLAESGLPLPRALRFAGNASDDRWLARKCRLVANDIEHGSPPATAVALADLPTSLGQVFRSARSKRNFAEALRGLSDIFAARCVIGSQLINSIIAPFAVSIVIGFIGLTAIALFLPLIKLLNDLS